MEVPRLESSASLVGLLKRGRGAGYLAALRSEASEVHEALLECICGDQTYWFSSWDDRHVYYATLGLAVGLPLAPIRAFIRSHPLLNGGGWPSETLDDVELACFVLAEMVKRGKAEAAEILVEEVRDGPAWWSAIEALANVELVLANTPELLDRAPIVDKGLLEELSDRLRKTDLIGEPPPAALRRYPQLRWLAPEVDFSETAAGRWRQQQPDFTGWSVGDLRTEALRSTPRSLAAARTLGARGDLYLLEPLVAALEADPGVPGVNSRKVAIDYLVALPPEHSLPLARRWLNERFPLSIVADSIFEASAEPADREPLEQTALAALADGEYYRVWTLSSALRRLADARSMPTLATIFEESPYALAREEALDGLIAIGDTSTEHLIVESLWDCDPGCRRRASTNVPLSDQTRVRLEEMRDDPLEEAETRAASRSRLA